MVVNFQIEGQNFMALNVGPLFKFTEATSFLIACETQDEVDYFWNKLTADGGQESQCGWLKDKFGLYWQVAPHDLGRIARRQRSQESATRHASHAENEKNRDSGVKARSARKGGKATKTQTIKTKDANSKKRKDQPDGSKHLRSSRDVHGLLLTPTREAPSPSRPSGARNLSSIEAAPRISDEHR